MSKDDKGAPRKGRSGPSGPSGVNRQPRITLRATQEEFDAWETARLSVPAPSLSEWIRAVCNKAAAKFR